MYSPTLVRVRDGSSRVKTMAWPLEFAPPNKELPSLDSFPAPSLPGVTLSTQESMVVGVSIFSIAATEAVARGYTKQLIGDMEGDGIRCADEAGAGDIRLAQFDALFSLNKRRNEVWVRAAEHPWE